MVEKDEFANIPEESETLEFFSKGRTIEDRYELQEKLGKGGYGLVWKAFDRKYNRDVAIKFLLSGYSEDEIAKARFNYECKVLQELKHPNIIHCYESGEFTTNGHLYSMYYVMKFVDGKSLKDKINEINEPREIAEIFKKLAEALQVVHKENIVHRDIKPSNIILEEGSNNPILVDFGLAKSKKENRELTQKGYLVGSSLYMSPEQTKGESTDIRTDIFSLGVTLYEFLTKQHPFGFDRSITKVYQNIQELDAKIPTKVNPKIPKPLSAIVLKCIEKEKGKRYASCGSLKEDLDNYINNKKVSASYPYIHKRVYRYIYRYIQRNYRKLLIIIPIVVVIAYFAYCYIGKQQEKAKIPYYIDTCSIEPLRTLMPSYPEDLTKQMAKKLDNPQINDMAHKIILSFSDNKDLINKIVSTLLEVSKDYQYRYKSVKLIEDIKEINLPCIGESFVSKEATLREAAIEVIGNLSKWNNDVINNLENSLEENATSSTKIVACRAIRNILDRTTGSGIPIISDSLIRHVVNLLKDQNILVRKVALETVSKIGIKQPDETISRLMENLKDQKEIRAKKTFLMAIGDICRNKPGTIKNRDEDARFFLKLLSEKQPLLITNAIIYALSRMPVSFNVKNDEFQNENEDVQEAWLYIWGMQNKIGDLYNVLENNKNSRLKLIATKILAEREDSIRMLTKALSNNDKEVKYLATCSFVITANKGFEIPVRELINLLSHKNEAIQEAASQALYGLYNIREKDELALKSLNSLVKGLEINDNITKMCIATAIAQIVRANDKQTIEKLIDLFNNKEVIIRDSADYALTRVGNIIDRDLELELRVEETLSLNQKIIPKSLKDKLQKVKISLSQNASIKLIKEDSEWEIWDDTQLTLKKEKDKLKIFQKSKPILIETLNKILNDILKKDIFNSEFSLKILKIYFILKVLEELDGKLTEENQNTLIFLSHFVKIFPIKIFTILNNNYQRKFEKYNNEYVIKMGIEKLLEYFKNREIPDTIVVRRKLEIFLKNQKFFEMINNWLPYDQLYEKLGSISKEIACSIIKDSRSFPSSHVRYKAILKLSQTTMKNEQEYKLLKEYIENKDEKDEDVCNAAERALEEIELKECKSSSELYVSIQKGFREINGVSLSDSARDIFSTYDFEPSRPFGYIWRVRIKRNEGLTLTWNNKNFSSLVLLRIYHMPLTEGPRISSLDIKINDLKEISILPSASDTLQCLWVDITAYLIPGENKISFFSSNISGVCHGVQQVMIWYSKF